MQMLYTLTFLTEQAMVDPGGIANWAQDLMRRTIGPLEQAFMEIRCPDGGDGGRREDFYYATHEQIHPTGMLSVVANLTPWSDHNQSPCNMYQCQVL
ncbi:hypothetical protein J5N97_029603 [Dioscorea zingiberensis]|uniref:DNA-directed RNA polymerase n=1 Tax=Dioscorea zingiberensis TaxID=325984 RepID=A0A9D5BW96_9LILI|nr:hypothetical protein J5N97_029603 [Dioscorea zingiberensis]